MPAITYKTHFLLGRRTGEKAVEIMLWEYAPTGPEVDAARNKVVSDYNEFVLVQPVGESYPGTYVVPPNYDMCG